ncbi:hypothetical protein F5X96DRAFT_150374 [Biscogniauxia mediterranea]|nr:hypothetical protein F5X96DRAFT_150374 [Biscogniauxia mediterranea]
MLSPRSHSDWVDWNIRWSRSGPLHCDPAMQLLDSRDTCARQSTEASLGFLLNEIRQQHGRYGSSFTSTNFVHQLTLLTIVRCSRTWPQIHIRKYRIPDIAATYLKALVPRFRGKTPTAFLILFYFIFLFLPPFPHHLRCRTTRYVYHHLHTVVT